MADAAGMTYNGEPGDVQLIGVTRRHGRGGAAVVALDDVSVRFAPGTYTAVMGPSGSGKSTLLQCAAGLDAPDAGEVLLDGTSLGGIGEEALSRMRRERVGFVFQAFNLLDSLTAEQNVALPLRLARRRVKRDEVRAALRAVGLEDRSRHRPAELSGGQQQRVAIARALLHRPSVLFADEPTGALDSASARRTLALLRGLHASGQTIVVVTHDPSVAAEAGEVLFLADGRIADRLTAPTPEAVAARMTRLESGAITC